MPTIEEATADQLIEELLHRFEAACFTGYREIPGSDEHVVVAVSRGPGPFCEGLLHAYLRRFADREWFDGSPEDEEGHG